MADMRFMLWNVEWMNDLFGPEDQPPQFRPDGEAPNHHPDTTVRTRRDDLSGVINELAPDIVVVVEGPTRTGELQLFFDEDVQGTWSTVVQRSLAGTQDIGIAIRTDGGKFADPPFTYSDTKGLEAFKAFMVDTDDDEVEEQYKFERLPLYVEVNSQDGKKFRILGLHLKSKLVAGAFEWSMWWQRADANRRKILAQATQLRLRFIDKYLQEPDTKDIPLIVCGDINDGPGLDASEKRLFGSGIERLMGIVWKPDLCLRSALFDTLDSKLQERLNFESIYTASYKDPIFNNVWQRDWIDHVLYTNCDGSPWVHDAQVHRKMTDGQMIWNKYKYASDHFPVTAIVTLP